MAGDPIKTSTLRVFLALPLSKSHQNCVADYLGRLPRGQKGLKWVKPENTHLTFHFFGSIEEERIRSLIQIIHPIVNQSEPLTLWLSDIGFFPNASRPRVIWIGVREEGCGLQSVYSKIKEALSKQGCEVENRPFFPHVTLGRVKFASKSCAEDLRRLPSFPQTKPVTTHELVLFKSELGPQGPTYHPLQHFPFQASK